MSAEHDSFNPGGGDYERPNGRYRCGRGAAWRKPCGAGPKPDGSCGGTAECEPVLKNGKYECRRPKSAGGRCAEGPKPDGTCAHCHPPCIPRLTLRARRGRLTWQVCGLALLILAAGFHFGVGTGSRPVLADPGPLSAKHASFAATQGCAACHAAHDQGVGGLIQAVFRPNDLTAQCARCHVFSGRENSPHNESFSWPADQRETDCRQCHVEHQGAQASITRITDGQCQTCHQVKFANFARGHPQFPADFPHARRGSIRFDHAKHLGDYFTRADFKSRAAADCAGCHVADRNERNVRTLGFDAACARCHAGQISQNELILLRLPEPTAPADLSKLGKEDATTFMAWLVSGGGTNAADYGPRLGAWFGQLAKGDAGALAQSMSEELNVGSGTNLLAGLSPGMIQRPIGLWLEQKKFEPPPGAAVSGWYWMEDLYPELRYKPAGHADPIVRSWVNFGLNAAIFPGGDRAAAGKFRDELTHVSTGPGRCMKCHVPSPVGKGLRTIAWDYAERKPEGHTTFSHGAHVSLAACAGCHVLNPKVDYDSQFKDTFVSPRGVSSFQGITTASCTRCHTENKVRSDCLLCHQYHRELERRPVQITAAK